ncbi:MAG: hypothetical protein HC782_03325, partial [Gammaproteobacteria bacterium]|nr:hypothetical protein [Gammaproteobacteria bacterium]
WAQPAAARLPRRQGYLFQSSPTLSLGRNPLAAIGLSTVMDVSILAHALAWAQPTLMQLTDLQRKLPRYPRTYQFAANYRRHQKNKSLYSRYLSIRYTKRERMRETNGLL